MVLDLCPLCVERFEKGHDKKEPEHLVLIGPDENVIACPRCDGGVVKLATRS